MTVEVVRHSGALKVSEFVTDGRNVWLHTETFMGYTRREARTLYRQAIRAEGWKVATP